MRIAVIVNPVSGLGTAAAPAGAARLELVRRVIRDAGAAIDVAATSRAGHAVELAREFRARGFSRVIAWGGDGTINEVAGPLIGGHTSLGIVPAGSGDGLARGLGLERGTVAAFRAAVAPPAGPLDVGMMGDRHFLNIAGLGFDADVAEAFNRRTTRSRYGYMRRTDRGRYGYMIDALRRVWPYESQSYAVDAGTHRANGPCFVVAFANCRQYGSGLVIAPEANPSDGHLDMVLVSGGSPWRQLWRARRLAFRRMAPAEGVVRALVTEATVSGERLHGHVDGQTFETSGTVTVSVRPGAILLAGLQNPRT